VLETTDLSVRAKERLIELAGQGTELHLRHNMYLELVSSGLPFLPQKAAYHRLNDLNAELHHLELEVLDSVDVVVSKLKRFHANDRSDIEAMIEKGLVPHDRLVSRFREAVDYYEGDARAEDFPRYVKNLHVVERDSFAVSESEIELPEWIDR
jgi:hypothetical protein